MDLSVIIVSFNVKKLLRDCLKSTWREMKRNRELKMEAIVIDNASRDGSARMVRHEFPQVILIENKKNLGFARAVNQGIKKAKGKYLLLLNPDTITKEGALKIMVDFVQTHPLAGVVGGRLFDPDGSLQGSCYRLPGIRRAIQEWWLGKEGISEKYTPKGKEPTEVEAVVGGAFLIPQKVIKKIGLFDERYFIYFEDLDFCRRARRAGFKVYYLPKAQFVHYHGASGRAIPGKTQRWLIESSQVYHGKIKYYLLTLIIWLGQKWQKFMAKF
jgi:GT2 family glycosyltransferase